MCERLNLDGITDAVPLVDIAGCYCKINTTVCNVYVIYIPPNLPLNDFSIFFLLLAGIIVVSGKHCILLGDYNVCFSYSE